MRKCLSLGAGVAAVTMVFGTGVASAASASFGSCGSQASAQFQCATVKVPVDRDNIRRGHIKLKTMRLTNSGKPGGPVLLALAGGPGQSATAIADTLAKVMAPALDEYQLVFFDQRGTGLSGALNCSSLNNVSNSTSGSQVFNALDRCSNKLGSKQNFYTTADSVLDIESVRGAIGASKLFLYGVSYGTFVATQYAQKFPAKVSALGLDSTMTKKGWDPYSLNSIEASRRILTDLCGNSQCQDITADPVGDTRSLVTKMGRQLTGDVIDSTGSSVQGGARPSDLYDVLFAGDLSPTLRAFYPGAVKAALNGDRQPLLRMVSIGSNQGVGKIVPFGVAGETNRELSTTLNEVTNCLDTRFPWSSPTASVEERISSTERALKKVSKTRLDPFNRSIALKVGLLGQCVFWPTTKLARAQNNRKLPNVPTLILSGEADMRTPLSNAQAAAKRLPQSVLVPVPHLGHSVITNASCAQEALRRFTHGDHTPAVGQVCAQNPEDFPPLPLQPTSIAQVTAPSDVPGLPGQTLRAAIRSLKDALYVALTVAPNGGPIHAGGLRAGKLSGTMGDTQSTILLDGYSLVPGVTITGDLVLGQNAQTGDTSVSGTFTVGGQSAATGQLTLSNATYTGQLGGQSINFSNR